MAAKVGLAASTVATWARKGRIPSWRHDAILAAAQRHDIALTKSELLSPGAASAPAQARDILAVLDEAGVDNLAKLPSLDELRGRLIGMIQTPAQRLAVLAQAPASQLARVFGAYGKKAA